MTKVNVVAEEEDKDQFTDILLLLIAVHPVSWDGEREGEREGGREREAPLL